MENVKFKSKSTGGWYEVYYNGENIGEVWKTVRYGLSFWKNNKDSNCIGKEGKLYSTRKEATEYLINNKNK